MFSLNDNNNYSEKSCFCNLVLKESKDSDSTVLSCSDLKQSIWQHERENKWALLLLSDFDSL